LLALELQSLMILDPAFAVGPTGFTIAETDSLIDNLAVEEPASPKDEILPPLADGPAVTQPGELWVLGKHRLISGETHCQKTWSPRCCGEGDVTTPFGGYKQSGFGGRDKSIHAHDQYTQLKTIWADLTESSGKAIN
jgi:hypothetical protein